MKYNHVLKSASLALLAFISLAASAAGWQRIYRVPVHPVQQQYRSSNNQFESLKPRSQRLMGIALGAGIIGAAAAPHIPLNDTYKVDKTSLAQVLNEDNERYGNNVVVGNRVGVHNTQAERTCNRVPVSRAADSQLYMYVDANCLQSLQRRQGANEEPTFRLSKTPGGQNYFSSTK